MFWTTLAPEERELDKKLNAEDSDLKTVLEDVHCLQEIRNSHESLMNFLKREDNFKQLITAILKPPCFDDGDEKAEPKDKYRFVHLCCEAVCIGVRDFYPEFEKRPEFVALLTDYFASNSSALNPLVVSFYSRVVISFLSADPEKFLGLLEESDFLENCLMALDNCSLFELLCTIANCMPDPCFRERIKMWYVKKEFAQRMLQNLRPSQPSTIHENTAALWVEFVKALREFQYNVEQCHDPLLDSIQSKETVSELLKLMFPQSDSDDDNENGDTFKIANPSVVSNGVLVLNALMETNHVRNSPSWLLSQEIQNISGEFLESSSQQLNGSFDSADGGSSSTGQQLLMDPMRLIESHCAEHAAEFMELIVKSLNKGSDALLGDQLCGCMQLLINLTNTNFLPTHVELLRAFSAPSDPLRQFFELVRENPNRSIFNAQLITLILHILYSSTGEQKPLIDFVIRDFNIPALIRQALPMEEDSFAISSVDEMGDARMTAIAKRSFFYQLANRLLMSQQNSPNAEYIERLIKELPDVNDWDEFCSNHVQSFVDQNRSEKVLSVSTTNRSSNAIEIDELPDDSITPLSNLILK